MSLHVQELEGVFLPILLSFSYYSFSPTICLIVPRYTLPERTLKDQILLLYVAKLFVVLALGKISRNRDTVNWLIALKGACFQSHDFDCQVVFTVRFHILSHNALYMLSTLFKWSFLKRFDFFLLLLLWLLLLERQIYTEKELQRKRSSVCWTTPLKRPLCLEMSAQMGYQWMQEIQPLSHRAWPSNEF